MTRCVHAGGRTDLLLLIWLDDIDTAPTAKAAVYQIIEPRFGYFPACQARIPTWAKSAAVSKPRVVCFRIGQSNSYLFTFAVTAKDYWNALLVPDFFKTVVIMHRHSAYLTPPRFSVQDECCWQLPALGSASAHSKILR